MVNNSPYCGSVTFWKQSIKLNVQCKSKPFCHCKTLMSFSTVSSIIEEPPFVMLHLGTAVDAVPGTSRAYHEYEEIKEHPVTQGETQLHINNIYIIGNKSAINSAKHMDFEHRYPFWF